MKADREASNAIVQLVSFYAGALGRAQSDNEVMSKHFESQARIMSEQQNEITVARNELSQCRRDVEELRIKVDTQAKQLRDEQAALAAERRRCNDLSREKSEVESKYAKLLTENERLQRVNIESHNERDKNVKSLREASEALGWLKSEANQFVEKLRWWVNEAGLIIEHPTDVLHALERLVNHWNATGGDDVFKKHKPNPKRKGLPPANEGQ